MKDEHILDGDRIFPGEGWYMNRAGDYIRCAITGQGNIPMYKCLKVLKDAGYEGYLIQEFEGIEDCIYAVEKGLKYAKRLLNVLDQGMWNEQV
jgi:sugar phosphate isomerase/epimerase